jgi:hypothetical protein
MTNKPPELVIGDPHEQPGLVARIPVGVDPVQIVNFYHYQFWPEKKRIVQNAARIDTETASLLD